MSEVKHKEVDGILWGETAIANIQWTGVSLRDLLLAAGIEQSKSHEAQLHVCISSHVAECEGSQSYDISIPLDRAMGESTDVLLAYSVNTLLPSFHCVAAHGIL